MEKIFNEYVNKFDLSEQEIVRKYEHSYRVMEYAIKIAKSINFDERNILITKICGLFHDIGRFEQWTKFKTFVDADSIDHGDLGANILKESIIDMLDLSNKEKEIVLNSVKYHNKYIVPKFDENIETFINIVRDADKLDIMKTQLLSNEDQNIIIKKEILEDILKNEICKNKFANDDTSRILRHISWINDLNFKYSYQILKDENIIDKKMKLISQGNSEDIKKLNDYVENKINLKLGCD